MDATLSTNPESQAVTLTKGRHFLCIEAVWEIEALARVLPGLVPLDTADSPHYAVRALAGRIASLSNALLSALDDDAETEDALRQRVLLTPTQELECTSPVSH